ncbi:MAG: hypothetical protein ACR2KK_14155 [Acidimicrobiales bacterium]
MRRAGAGLALLYVVVALVTDQLSSRPVLPLFDGFAPPAPYQWVNPPPERAGDNVAPQPVEREFALAPDGAPASSATTDDAQAIVGLDKGSVPASAGDTAVVVRLVPTDAGTLGPLPPGLRAVSNAYKVELRYVPSQTPLTRLAVKGTLALTATGPGDRLLHSTDGRTWQERAFRPFGQDHGLFTELEDVGWFVVASSARPSSTGDGAGSNAVRGFLLVLLGVAPIVGAILVVRLPSPVPAARPGPRKAAKRRR